MSERTLVLSLLLFLAAPATSALARKTSVPRVVVLVAARDQQAKATRAIAALRAQLSDTRVVFHVTWVPRLTTTPAALAALARRVGARPGAVAVVIYDLSANAGIHLYSAGTRGPAAWRTVSARGARYEALAIIARLAILALIRGAPPPPRRVQPRPSPPRRAVPRRVALRPVARPRMWPGVSVQAVPPRVRAGAAVRVPAVRRTVAMHPRRPAAATVRRRYVPKPRRRWLGLELAYAFDAQASGGDGVTHGGAIALTLKLPLRFTLLLGFRGSEPIRGRVGDVRARMQHLPLSLGVRWHHRFGRVSLGAALHLIVNPVLLHTASDDPAIATGGDQIRVLASLLPALYASLEIAPRLRLYLRVGAQIGFNFSHYQVELINGPAPLIRAWPVQPSTHLGLGIDLW